MSVEPNSARSGDGWFIDAAAKSEVAKMRRGLYRHHFEIGWERSQQRLREAEARHEEFLAATDPREPTATP